MQCGNVSGWMAQVELCWLAEKAKSARLIVELGSWKGRSAVCFAEHTPGTVICIDHFDGAPNTGVYGELRQPNGREKVRDSFLAATREWMQAGRLFLLEMSTVEGLTYLSGLLKHRPADLIFIDADHAEQAVRSDIEASLPLLRRGGLLCGHDVELKGVQAATRDLLPGVKRGPQSIWFWEKS